LELSLSIPKAGAWYGYAERAFGRYVGFLVGLTSWLGTVTALGFGSYTFSEYLALIFPVLSDYLMICAISLLVILWVFHQLGVVLAGKSQEWLSGIKALALLIFIGICAVHGTGGALAEAAAAPEGLPIWSGIMTALLSIFYAFDGWHTAAYFTEENKDPVKSMPKSMFIGVIVVAMIYLLINLAILYTLPLAELSHSKLAAADAMQMIFGPGVGKAITLFLMLSIIGILNTQVMFAPRVIYSMGRDGLFFPQVTRVNAVGSPTVATHMTVFLLAYFYWEVKRLMNACRTLLLSFCRQLFIGFCSLTPLAKNRTESRKTIPGVGISRLALGLIGDFYFVFVGYIINKSSQHTVCDWLYLVFVCGLSKVPKNSISAFLLALTGWFAKFVIIENTYFFPSAV